MFRAEKRAHAKAQRLVDPGVFEEQQGSQGAWSRVSEGLVGRGEGREGTGKACRALWASGRSWTCTQKEMRAMAVLSREGM